MSAMEQPVRIVAGCCGFCVPAPRSVRCCSHSSNSRPSSAKAGWSSEHDSPDRRTSPNRHPARYHAVLVGRRRQHPASLPVDRVPTSIASDMRLKIRVWQTLIMLVVILSADAGTWLNSPEVSVSCRKNPGTVNRMSVSLRILGTSRASSDSNARMSKVPVTLRMQLLT